MAGGDIFLSSVNRIFLSLNGGWIFLFLYKLLAWEKSRVLNRRRHPAIDHRLIWDL